MKRESVEEFFARGGKVTVCPTRKSKGSGNPFEWKYSINIQGRKASSLAAK